MTDRLGLLILPPFHRPRKSGHSLFLRACVCLDSRPETDGVLSGAGLLGVSRVASSEYLDLHIKYLSMDFSQESLTTVLPCLSLDERHQELMLVVTYVN